MIDFKKQIAEALAGAVEGLAAEETAPATEEAPVAETPEN